MTAPRFKARVYAYHHGRWLWAYEIRDMRPLRADWKPGHPIAGRAQFGSQPEALRGAIGTLENLGTVPGRGCRVADTCAVDPACEFAATCRRIEAS